MYLKASQRFRNASQSGGVGGVGCEKQQLVYRKHYPCTGPATAVRTGAVPRDRQEALQSSVLSLYGCETCCETKEGAVAQGIFSCPIVSRAPLALHGV